MFTLNIAISALALYITVAAVETTNAVVKLSYSWTEIASKKDSPPLYGSGSHPSLTTIFISDNSHSLALLRWHNITETHPSVVNLTVRTHTFDGQGQDKLCDIASPPEKYSDLIAPTDVEFLKSDRVLLVWKEKHKVEGERLKLQVISTDTCKSSEYIDMNAVPGTSSFAYMEIGKLLVRLKDTFEIFVRFPLACPGQSSYDVTCHLALNYEGTLMTPEPEVITTGSLGKMWLNEAHGMKYNGGEGYVFFAINDTVNYPSQEQHYGWFAYMPTLGWIPLRRDVLYNKAYYSNSSGFASVCWIPDDYELRCKWLDATHDLNETLAVKLHSDFNDTAMDFSTINSPDGHVVILYLQANERGHFLAADEIQSNGQCKRVAKIPIPSVPKKVKLSIGSQNQYCFSYVTEKLLTENPSIYEDTFESRCTPALDEASLELHICGENY